MARVDILQARFSRDRHGSRLIIERRAYLPHSPGIPPTKEVILLLRGHAADLSDSDWLTIADDFWTDPPQGTLSPPEHVIIDGRPWVRRTATIYLPSEDASDKDEIILDMRD